MNELKLHLSAFLPPPPLAKAVQCTLRRVV